MRFKVIAHVDTFAFLVSLHARLDLFDLHTLRQDYPASAHKDTRTIFLAGPEHPGLENWLLDVPHIKYPLLAEWPEADGLLRHIGNLLPPRPLGKVMLVELAAGGAVGWHVDEGAYAEAHDRYHLPIVINPGAMLYSGGEQAHVPTGLLTWFDNHALHSAVNFGASARIHLILDVRKDGV